MKYLCMSPDEFDAWSAAADFAYRSTGVFRPQGPCIDCPASYEREMKAAGLCIRKSTVERRRSGRLFATRRREEVAA